MNKFHRLLGASCLIAQPLLLNILAIPATAYIIRELGPDGYGQWAISNALVAVVICLTNLGLRPLFIRNVAQDPESAQAALAEQLGVRTLLAILAALITEAACVCMGYPAVVLQCTALASVGLIFTVVLFTFSDLLQALHRFPLIATVNLVAGIVLTGASVLMIWLGLGPVGLSCAYALGPLTGAVIAALLVRRLLFPVTVHWNLRRFRELLWQSRVLGAQQILSATQAQAEGLLVPKLLGYAASGYFTAGSLLASRLILVPDGLGTAFYPMIAQQHKRGLEHTARAVARYMGLSLSLCILIALGASLTAPYLGDILFPGRAAQCTMVIQITVWALPLLALGQGMEYAMNAVGKHAEQARSAMGATVCSLALAVILVYFLGLQGACYSWVGRQALLAAFRLPGFIRTFAPAFLPLRAVCRRWFLELAFRTDQ